MRVVPQWASAGMHAALCIRRRDAWLLCCIPMHSPGREQQRVQRIPPNSPGTWAPASPADHAEPARARAPASSADPPYTNAILSKRAFLLFFYVDVANDLVPSVHRSSFTVFFFTYWGSVYALLTMFTRGRRIQSTLRDLQNVVTLQARIA